MELAPNTFGRIDDEGCLSTGWLDPCIGVVVYDPQHNIAHMAHLQGVFSPNMQTLADFVDAMRDEFADLSRLRAVIRGSHSWSSDNLEQKEHLRKEREHVISALRIMGLNYLDVKWGADNHISRLTYDVPARILIEESMYNPR
ncbi:MAG TPA: hypothetical protein VJC21_02495 [Candidatus Nanoarchaeia archaeon]|nr:hypothetical protein [Candidatus Nanoarchaeia archaeon]